MGSADALRKHEILVESADELLDVLSARREPWNNRASLTWVFRGQPCVSLKLLPKAWRDDHLAQLGDHGRDASGRAFFEAHFLSLFLEGAHRQGLRVPGPSKSLDELRTTGNLSPDIPSQPGLWPPYELLPALALAQHHGVPTRLLDWTYRAYVAAYFAALAAMGRQPPPQRLAVWCLNSTRMRVCLQGNARLLPVTSDGNANLAAQRGAFTLLSGTAVRGGAPDLTGIDDLLPEDHEVLRCYSLPVSEAPALVELLRAEDVDGAALFPGFGGAASFALDVMKIDAARRQAP